MTFVIGVATIVVDQDCNNYGLSCNDSVFFATMVVGVATMVVGVATIVVDVTILNIMTIVITTRCPNPPANRQVLTLIVKTQLKLEQQIIYQLNNSSE